MSCRELIESLRNAAGERTRVLWREAEQEAASFRQETLLRLEQMRSELDRRRTAPSNDMSPAVAEARNRGRAFRLFARQALSERLYQAALSSLPALRQRDPEKLFQSLAGELPQLPWETVRVNPADAALARKLFPGAEVVPDGTISGGMDASTGGGSIRVINTFEKRLERIWSELLPSLMREVEQEVSDASPSA